MISKIGGFLQSIKKLTKEQKKIIYVSLICFVFLLIFWLMVYIPQSKRFALVKKDLASVEAQIAEIMKITKGEDLSQVMKDFKINFNRVSSKLPAQDETVISSLTEMAKKTKANIRNITPGARQILESKIPGYELQEMPISLDLTCEDRSLGEFLDMLRNHSQVLVRVEKVNINGKGEGEGNLDVDLQISAYLSKKIN